MRFMVWTENTGDEILLFLVVGSFEKIFSLKMFLKIQPNAFPSPFLFPVKMKTENNQTNTPPKRFKDKNRR